MSNIIQSTHRLPRSAEDFNFFTINLHYFTIYPGFIRILHPNKRSNHITDSSSLKSKECQSLKYQVNCITTFFHSALLKISSVKAKLLLVYISLKIKWRPQFHAALLKIRIVPRVARYKHWFVQRLRDREGRATAPTLPPSPPAATSSWPQPLAPCTFKLCWNPLSYNWFSWVRSTLCSSLVCALGESEKCDINFLRN
jgi:hypothetical protein